MKELNDNVRQEIELAEYLHGIFNNEEDEINSRQFLSDIGFLTAPASTKYHGNYNGGLFEHSSNVAESLLKLTYDNHLQWERVQSPIIIGLFHDLCKCDQYEKEGDAYQYRKDILIPGHGIKSVLIAQKFMKLTDEEIACIVYHMGAFTEKEEWNNYTNAIHKYPNVLWTHTADMIATHIMEK